MKGCRRPLGRPISLLFLLQTRRTAVFPPETPASVVLSSALQHHIESATPSRGQAIHAHILKAGFRPMANIFIKLLILHLKCGSLRHARQVFDQMPDPPVSAYSYMISGYFKRGLVEESISLVRRVGISDEKPYWFILSMTLKMSSVWGLDGVVKQVHARIVRLCREFDEVLFTALIDSYAKNGKMGWARAVFEELAVRNFVCCTALITGYMNQGSVCEAEEVFANTPEKDIVVFNAMIEGYSNKIETAKKALEIFKDMQRSVFRPTISTFVSVIGACSTLSDLEFGQQLHCQLERTDIIFHVKIGSALVDMYCKCGRIEDAKGMFNYMPEKNVVTWTSMIDGYGKNGSPYKALNLFYDMRNDLNVRPNYVTFLGALSACGHAGFVSDGKQIFESMKRVYSIKPRMEHYACMVDLLGRAGRVGEAFDFIKQMDVKPNSDVWAALLGACRLHGDLELASIASKEIFELCPDRRPGAYVALSNSFASAEQWDSVSEVRELMKERGVSKDTGRSWVGTDEGLHGFHVGERKLIPYR